ncbi:four helix bundle protein [Salinibacter ruber]|uniref:Four helix bundle protein n=1 Tax=Salinibacter ruber TaxID=146919 RepID=A0A9X2Q0G6_9BACT|nr:four helix bundle protein [Salinibacter ruber]MCS3678777.1 four helix bundle protein [Salinibacter ruber]MCS3682394.1 four helix bundle protein [Salinibacter ruber]
MAYKFEDLEVWTRALDYSDQVHDIAEQLPKHERYNLSDQMTRAANSIALNIAEGSTGQSDAEQDRFLRIAIRSLLETVACFHLINRRDYLDDLGLLREAYHDSETLFAKLQAFRASLDTDSTVREAPIEYDEGAPF